MDGFPPSRQRSHTSPGHRFPSCIRGRLSASFSFAFFPLSVRLQASGVNCQPWFHPRLVAHGFLELSEEAYGGPETLPCDGMAYPDGRHSSSNPSAQSPCKLRQIRSPTSYHAFKPLVTSLVPRRTLLPSSRHSARCRDLASQGWPRHLRSAGANPKY
jgi:hypothetical protein